MHEVRLPDGSTIAFPDGMSDADIANVVKSQLNPVSHAAGAAATGVYQGIAGLAGAPVDLANMGINAAAQTLGPIQAGLNAALPPAMQRYATQPASPAQVGGAPFGGSQSIQSGITGLVGETPPVGKAEQYLQAAGQGAGAAAGGMLTGGALNMAQLAPMLSRALGGGADSLKAALTNLFAGGAAGAGQRAGQQGATAVTDNPALQEAAGLVAGGALGVGAGLAPTAAQGVYSRYLAPAEARATNAIRRSFNQGVAGGAPNLTATREFLNQPETVAAGLTSKPLAMADVQNQPLQALAERAAQTPGTAAQTARGFLTQRDVDAGSRLVGDLQENMAAGPSAYRSAQQITQVQSQQSKPLYDAAFSHPANQAIAHPDIDQILATPAGQAAFAKARATMANEGLPVPTSTAPDLRTLDYMKRELDDLRGAALREGANNGARIFGNMTKRLVGAMDTADASGSYAKARSTFAGHAAAKDALEEGAAIFKKNPELVADEIAGLSPSEKQHYIVGARDALSQRIAQTSSGGNEALKIVGNDQIQKQLRPLFDTDKQFDAFIKQASLESLMYGTRFQNLGGSQTFRRLAAENEGLGSGIASNALTAIGAAASHEPVVAAMSTTRLLGKLLSSMTGLTPAVRAQVANKLFTDDPAALQKLLGELSPNAGVPFSIAPALLTGPLPGERMRK
jgi:hypothetical protein